MTIDNMTYGIELEVTMPNNVRLSVGSYTNGTQVPGLPAGWVAKHDGSIRPARGFFGVEIVSPVLSGAEGVRQILEVAAWLRSSGARVNQSTGLHVHVGWNHADTDGLKRLVTLTSNHEQALYASTGTKSRQAGMYCQPIQSSRAHQERFVRDTQGVGMGRYYCLNVETRKPTVEFRCFAGTLNSVKIIGYLRMCLGIVEKAANAKRNVKWVAKPTAPNSPVKRSGDGQTALTRLFYALGWTKGRTDHVHGAVDSESAPSIEKTKRALMKLARKYDKGA